MYADADDLIKKIAAQFNTWSYGAQIEKVYLQLDKPYYAAGDNIWFKGYVTAGSKHQLSSISNILNVELIDESDSVKRFIKLPVVDGMAWGDFKLTDTLKEGNYRIRAYTNWMRNAGEDYFFDKTIQIGNSINNTVFTKASYMYSNKNKRQNVDVQINYADVDENPYANKTVTYEVQLARKTITSGKAVTNSNGDINLSFVNNGPNLRKNGSIITYIRLGNTFITKTIPIKATSADVDIQFFPESGYLVNGIRNRLAFKAVGADGLGVDIKGVVIDDQDTKIAQITTEHLGMGDFYILPQHGKSYTAKITCTDGSEKTVKLPDANDEGFVMNIYNHYDTNDITTKLSMSENTFREHKNDEIILIAQCGGSIVYAGKTRVETSSFSIKTARNRFPSGIAQFTLFTSKGEPLNERIVFIQNPDQLNVAINTPKPIYSPREKVRLNVEAKDKLGKMVRGAFSVSITDESKVKTDEDNESNILSNILLTSDIKGYIEKPNYYFNSVNDKTRADLDLLMLTQGYRRFAWKQIMAGDFPKQVFQPEKSLEISGHMKNILGRPVARGKVTLFSKTGGFLTLDTVTDDKGRFTFDNLIFSDSARFVIQGRNAKGGDKVEIVLDNIAPQLVTHNINSADIEINISSNILAYLKNSKAQYDEFLKYGLASRSHVLKEVAITDKRIIYKDSQNLNGGGNADQAFKMDQQYMCPTLEICLQGKLAGVRFINQVPYSSRTMYSSLQSGGDKPVLTPMQVVLDGMYVPASVMKTISPADIETVEVLQSIIYTSIYGVQGYGGVIVLTTKRGGSNYKRYSPEIITYKPTGIYPAREFYSPHYDAPNTNAKVADLRSTIYWNPNIITDENGMACVEFFNADNPGIYRAVIEGIDANGNIGRQVFRYKVE